MSETAPKSAYVYRRVSRNGGAYSMARLSKYSVSATQLAREAGVCAMTAYRQIRAAAGLCYNCGNEPPEAGLKACRNCSDKFNSRQRKYINSNPEVLAKMKKRQRDWYYRQRPKMLAARRERRRHKITMQDLADKLGISRERVRQYRIALEGKPMSDGTYPLAATKERYKALLESAEAEIRKERGLG